MRKWLILLFFLITASTFPSEPPPLPPQDTAYTIHQVIALALENNKDILSGKQVVRQYRYKLKQNMDFLPSVNLEGTRNLDEKLMVIELPSMVPGAPPQTTTLDFTKKYEFSLQIVQPLFNGGSVWLNHQNARLDLDIAREKHKHIKKEIILAVKKAFQNILVLEELLKAHNEALKLAETNFRNIDERYKLGMVSKYDRLRAQLAVSGAKPDILRIKKQLALSRYNLKFMTGLPENQPLNLKGELTYSAHQLNDTEIIRKTLLNASEVVQLKKQIKKNNNLLKMAYGQFLPGINLVASYSYRADALKFTPNNWEDFYTINLAFSFPIFTGFKRSARVGEMKVLKKILGLNLRRLNDSLKLQMLGLCMTVREEYENIQTGKQQIETAREGTRIAGLNYDEGLISILELNSSINELTQAKVRYLQAVYNYNIAIAEIEKISGTTIKGRIKGGTQ